MTSSNAVAQRININDLSSVNRQKLAKDTYVQRSYFQKLFSADTVEFNCPASATAFREQIARLLLEKKLVKQNVSPEQLHEVLSDEMKAYNFDDGVNKISTYFYDTDEQFMRVYHQFIRHVRNNFVKEPFWFQATPTLRLHCPNGLNNHHYPRYHADIVYGHPPEEINIWVPLTEFTTTHGFRIMTLENSKKLLEKFDYDYSAFVDSAIHDKAFSKECEDLATPVTTALGNMIAFDSRCLHSGEPLTTHTRISMDIRILPISQYKKTNLQYQGSGRRKILFAPGHCYHEQHSDDFLKGI